MQTKSDTIKVKRGDTYSAHLGGNGDKGIVSATIVVHRPSGRVVADWTNEDEFILGHHVDEFAARGYTVTPWASEAGR